MNRIIKFRAWDGTQMLDDVPPSVVPLGANAIIRGTTCEVMQFTSLHDKNGKEIYEGDLVNVNGAKGIVRIGWLENRYSFGYLYPTGEFLSPFSFFRDGKGGFIKDFIEVIGNIYENPELIK